MPFLGLVLTATLLLAGLSTVIAMEPAGVALLPPVHPTTLQPDPTVATIVGQVDEATLWQYEAWLTGEEPAPIGGEPYTISTRHTYSGVPMQKATQFAYEHFEELGLDVTYHQWADITDPNVVATKPGLSKRDDIYLLSAHLDDLPWQGPAPGADDNASGSVAVLAMADILSQYKFGCTLKFALWTGEEQGLLGSTAWVKQAQTENLNIKGVLNLDMIAYNSDATPAMDLHARSRLPGSLELAETFSNVVKAYAIDLVPEVKIDDWMGDYSDNASFWQKGYVAILATEDDEDFNPNYHSIEDQLSTLDMTYFADFVRASLATFVHASDCLIGQEMGSVNGFVTAATTAAAGTPHSYGPLVGASVHMEDQGGNDYETQTDVSGYYTKTLPSASYTVTVSAYGYRPGTIAGVVVKPDRVTSQNFGLEPAPVALVAPPMVEATLLSGGSITQTLWLTNSGKATLAFAISEQAQSGSTLAPLPWLSTRPVSGTVAAGQATTIAVSFAAAGLAPAAYGGLLDLETNDPLATHIGVPVTLTVKPGRWHALLPVIQMRR
jgi:hypothetical protein